MKFQKFVIMILSGAKADVKRQELKEIVAVSHNFFRS